MTVSLIPMTAADHAEWLAQAVPGYANEKVLSGAWQPPEAQQRATALTARLLPQGRETPGHYFFTVTLAETGAKIGFLWLGKGEAPDSACLYDIHIAPAFRRQGHGRRALLALEQTAATLGFKAIALHVFGHNRAAESLYRSLGYEVTDLNMRKRLAPKN